MQTPKSMYRMHKMQKALLRSGFSIFYTGLGSYQVRDGANRDVGHLLYSKDGYPYVIEFFADNHSPACMEISDTLEKAWKIFDTKPGAK